MAGITVYSLPAIVPLFANEYMETPKQKYGKRKTESKISVRHYLNTKIKGKKFGEKIYYPIYIQIIHRGKVNFAKSLLNAESTIEEFELFKTTHREDLNDEILIITDKISQLSSELHEKFTLKNIVGDNEFIYYPIIECLKTELKKAILPLDTKAKKSIIDPVTGEPLVEDLNSAEYLERLFQCSVLKYTIDWENAFEEILEGLLIISHSNQKLLELKHDFVKDVTFFDLLLNPSLHSQSEITLGSWQIGYAQTRLRRLYKDTDKAEMCEEYIESLTHLLKSYNRIA
jgi:hypothetical protein